MGNIDVTENIVVEKLDYFVVFDVRRAYKRGTIWMIVIQNVSIFKRSEKNMENSTQTNSNSAPQNTDKSAVMKEICSKWSKFSEQDVAAMKGKADLVSQVVTKYGLPQIQAQSEVDALLKGRHIGAGA